MMSKAEARKVAEKLPGPPQRLMRFKCFEVMVAWLELHDLDIVVYSGAGGAVDFLRRLRWKVKVVFGSLDFYFCRRCVRWRLCSW